MYMSLLSAQDNVAEINRILKSGSSAIVESLMKHNLFTDYELYLNSRSSKFPYTYTWLFDTKVIGYVIDHQE